MSEQKWTREPWKASGATVETEDEYVDMIADGSRPKKNATPQRLLIATADWIGYLNTKVQSSEWQKANADRIVACVNALAGIPDPQAFMDEVRRVLTGVRKYASKGCEGEDNTTIENIDALLAKMPKREP